MYLLAKCQHNENNNTTDNAKWGTEQKRDGDLCYVRTKIRPWKNSDITDATE